MTIVILKRLFLETLKNTCAGLAHKNAILEYPMAVTTSLKIND